MRFTEQDRRELINRLKKIRDPRERDRVLWALADQDQNVFHDARPTATPSRLEPVRPGPDRPSSINARQRDMPQINFNPGRVLQFVVPAFFIIFGLIRIGQAAMNYMASQDIEVEIPNLVMGGIFLIIGLAGVFRAMRPSRIKQEEAP
jgi:hypothetical protein